MKFEIPDVLKKQVDAESWYDRPPTEGGPAGILRDLVLPEDLLAAAAEGAAEGFRAIAMRSIDLDDGSRLLRTTWRAAENEEVVVRVDLRECEDRKAAHDVLLELLAHMQAPDVCKLDEGTAGEVCLGRKESSASRIFVRNNIAVSIVNGGSEVVPVEEIAATIDRWIIGQAG